MCRSNLPGNITVGSPSLRVMRRGAMNWALHATPTQVHHVSPARILLANATGRRICRGNMAGASPATTMIRLGKPMHSCHGSGTPCGDPVWETGNHARLHSIFHSPAESFRGRDERRVLFPGQTI